MDILFKVLSAIMLAVLLSVQVVLAVAHRGDEDSDGLNGRPVSAYETTIRRGSVTLNSLGTYKPNSASVLINGDLWKTVDTFPVSMDVAHGDVVEILVDKDAPAFYIYLTQRSAAFDTDTKPGTILLQAGINRIFKVVIKK